MAASFPFIFIRESTAFLFFHNFDSVQRCSLIFSDLVEKRITKFDLQRKNGHFQIWEAYVNLVNQLRINQFSSFLINLLPSPSVLWFFESSGIHLQPPVTWTFVAFLISLHLIKSLKLEHDTVFHKNKPVCIPISSCVSVCLSNKCWDIRLVQSTHSHGRVVSHWLS